MRVDGNDVLASYAVTRKALDDARDGQGPTLIEAFTYRMGAHTTSDDPTRYRVAASWRLEAQGPARADEGLPLPQQLVDRDFFGELEAEADALAARIRKGVPGAGRPRPAVDVRPRLCRATPLLDEQRAQFAAYLAGFDGEVH